MDILRYLGPIRRISQVFGICRRQTGAAPAPDLRPQLEPQEAFSQDGRVQSGANQISGDKSPRKFCGRCFRRTNIDYGRIDYGVAGSAPQVWEINTHPTILKLTPRLTEAFEAIDTAGDGDSVPISFRCETLEQIERKVRVDRGIQAFELQFRPWHRHRFSYRSNRCLRTGWHKQQRFYSLPEVPQWPFPQVQWNSLPNNSNFPADAIVKAGCL